MTAHNGQTDKLDVILGVCATYGTQMLGHPEQEQYIEGFKNSRTYKEATQAISELIREARIDEVSSLEKVAYTEPVLAVGGTVRLYCDARKKELEAQSELNSNKEQE